MNGSVDAPLSPEYRVLGVRVNAVQIADVIHQMHEWIARRDACHSIAVTGMHGVTEANHDYHFKRALQAATLVVPDGMPLVWLARRHGFPLARRVYGPELMLTFFSETAGKNYRHFFYGGAPGVPEKLAKKLTAQFPDHMVAGTLSPPYRRLTSQEDDAVVSIIEKSRADVVWVGLGTPKQEHWMFEHQHRLGVPVLVSVGAAFDIHTGRLRRAPAWMSENGLEWLFRLCQEPRRLWRRYLLCGSEFAALVLLELFGLKKFE
jgi:N-acetylglucosaminyldiphosphoundecaprenol N-acetyl-beta-D-mannosaminyltransferase